MLAVTKDPISCHYLQGEKKSKRNKGGEKKVWLPNSKSALKSTTQDLPGGDG